MYDSRPGTALGKPPIDPFHGFPEHFPPGTHCNRSRGKSVLGSHETGLWGLPRAAIIHTTNLPPVCPQSGPCIPPVCPSQAHVFHSYAPVQARTQSRSVRSPGPYVSVQARSTGGRLGNGCINSHLPAPCKFHTDFFLEASRCFAAAGQVLQVRTAWPGKCAKCAPIFCPSQARVFHPFVPARPVYSTRMPQSRPVRSPGPCAVQARMSQSRPEALGGGWVMGALTHTCQRLVNSIQISFWKQVGVLQQPGKFSKFAPPGRVSVQSVHRCFGRASFKPVLYTKCRQRESSLPKKSKKSFPCEVWNPPLLFENASE